MLSNAIDNFKYRTVEVLNNIISNKVLVGVVVCAIIAGCVGGVVRTNIAYGSTPEIKNQIQEFQEEDYEFDIYKAYEDTKYKPSTQVSTEGIPANIQR